MVKSLSFKGKSKQQVIDLFSKVVAGNHELFQIDLDTKIWTSGPARFAQIPDWYKRGLTRPNIKTDLPTTKDKAYRKLKPFKKDKDGKLKPYKDLVIYPSIDPYDPDTRAMARLLMTENPTILESSETLQQLIITNSTRTIQPRQEMELEEGALEQWENTPMFVPYWGEERTPKEILKWFDGYCKTLSFDALLFDSYMFVREQGRTCIGMFPLDRKANGQLPLPQGLKEIRSELLRRPITNLDTGEMTGVEVSNLTANGSILSTKRAVYINNSKNLDLFGDFYGKIPIRPLLDAGKIIQLIIGRDWEQAILQTWHTKPIFKHTIPSKDWSKVKTLLDDFNSLMEQSQNKVVSVTNNVELLNPNGTDSGDIAGVNAILDEAIKIVHGFDNIPPYLLGRGEGGNLGGNANAEEVEGFLKIKIKPQQEFYEEIAEKQFYDKIVAILFGVEPEEVDETPISFKHNFEKPNIAVPLTTDDWNIHMFLVQNNFTTMEKVMEKFGMRDMMVDSPTLGTDTTPGQKIFDPHSKPGHSSWRGGVGRFPSRPLKTNFMVSPHDTINEMTQKKSELIDTIKNKVKGEDKFAKNTKKMERDFKIKEQQLIAKLDKEKQKWAKTREKEFISAKKNVK